MLRTLYVTINSHILDGFITPITPFVDHSYAKKTRFCLGREGERQTKERGGKDRLWGVSGASKSLKKSELYACAKNPALKLT